MFYFLAAAEAGAPAGGEGAPAGGAMAALLQLGIPILIMVVVFYFFLYRPQKKQDKQIADMRNSLQVGDEITTMGGIVGMIVQIKDDSVLIETGGDKTKLKIAKWAVRSKESSVSD